MSDSAIQTPALDWSTFIRRPAEWIDPLRLNACFDYRLSPELCGRLKQTPRLQNRLSKLISENYALGPSLAALKMSDVDRAIALTSQDHLIALVRRAGAIYWAKAIAGVVLAQQVKTLHAQLGEELYVFALGHQDLAGAKQQFEPLDGASAQIETDGLRCLGAWCRTQLDDTGKRVRLRLPASPALDDPPEPPFAEIGPSIVRRAAS
jgi:hypothetical protein